MTRTNKTYIFLNIYNENFYAIIFNGDTGIEVEIVEIARDRY